MKSRYDLSHLGASPIGDENIQQPQQKDFLSNFLTSTGKNANAPIYEEVGRPSLAELGKGALPAIGAAGMMIQPELFAARGMLPYIGNALSRIGTSTISGGLLGTGREGQEGTLEKGLESAKETLPLAAGMEALPLPFKFAQRFAEKIKPMEWTKNKIKDIQNQFKSAKEATKNEYQPVMEKAGNETLFPQSYATTYKEIKDYFSPSVKKMHKAFLKDPTIENAHKLQSQMFSDISKISSHAPDALTSNTIDALSQGREALKNDLIEELENINPELANKYKQGSYIHKTQVSPYLSNETLSNVAKGNVNELEPKDLLSALQNIKGDKEALGKHYLTKSLNELSDKMNLGKALQYIVPTATTVGAGELLSPGLGGLIGGLSAGGLMSHYATPKAVEFIQNPYMNKLISNYLNPTYRTLGKTALGYSQME